MPLLLNVNPREVGLARLAGDQRVVLRQCARAPDGAHVDAALPQRGPVPLRIRPQAARTARLESQAVVISTLKPSTCDFLTLLTLPPHIKLFLTKARLSDRNLQPGHISGPIKALLGRMFHSCAPTPMAQK